jgi:hypothetical protein
MDGLDAPSTESLRLGGEDQATTPFIQVNDQPGQLLPEARDVHVDISKDEVLLLLERIGYI